ncbi:hypothetical protein BDW22DRAFT_1432536 [Trametopsis cervina]|nr:hypothetical protein BDW22DRAFT_1432536 [Trametopsis cervina]
MTRIVHDISTESMPNVASPDPEVSLSYGNAHANLLDTTPTGIHSSEEARAVSTRAEDDNSGEDKDITGSEGLTMLAGVAVNIASVGSPPEVVAGIRQAEATHSNTTNDATTPNAPSPQIRFVTEIACSQGIQSDHGDGSRLPEVTPRRFSASNGSVDHELVTDLHSLPSAATLSSSSYDHPSKPDWPPETARRESVHKESSAICSSVGEDIKEPTRASEPSGSEAIETVVAGSCETAKKP